MVAAAAAAAARAGGLIRTGRSDRLGGRRRSRRKLSIYVQKPKAAFVVAQCAPVKGMDVLALSSRAEFAFMAVAPLLPTMTTVGPVLTIGSPAISSAGGSRPALEQGGELKVATERRRRRCALSDQS